MRFMRLLFVAGAGALAGLLLAPKRGAELRQEVGQRLGPLLSAAGLSARSGDQVRMASRAPAGDELQSKIEETRRRLEEQRQAENSA